MQSYIALYEAGLEKLAEQFNAPAQPPPTDDEKEEPNAASER